MIKKYQSIELQDSWLEVRLVFR